MTFAQGQAVGAGRREFISALVYGLVVLGLLGFAFSTASGLFDGAQAVAALRQRLADLDGRARSKAAPSADGGAPGTGSPFLEGQTVTLAGAALQQRIERAVAKAGGALLSSQVELDGPKAGDGVLRLTANLEIGQSALQPLLYDLEAGMPYLFVDSLDAQAPQAFGEAESAGMRITIAVSGEWRPAK
jgi:general secretion pathway protein M